MPHIEWESNSCNLEPHVQIFAHFLVGSYIHFVASPGFVDQVVFIAPICAGSGLPEAKSYLNGNFVPSLGHGGFLEKPRNLQKSGVFEGVCSFIIDCL